MHPASSGDDVARPVQKKIRVELFRLGERCRVEELVRAVANSVRWRGAVDLKVTQVGEGPVASTPHGPIDESTVVVGGTHIIRDADYPSLIRALEDCDEAEAV